MSLATGAVMVIHQARYRLPWTVLSLVSMVRNAVESINVRHLVDLWTSAIGKLGVGGAKLGSNEGIG